MRFVAGFLEIHAMLDQLGAQRRHRGVLLRAVAERDDNRDGKIEAAARPGQRLAMVAASGGDEAPAGRLVASEHHPAANLEGAGWKVIFMFNPDLGTGARAQQRPAYLRGSGQVGVHQIRRLLEVG